MRWGKTAVAVLAGVAWAASVSPENGRDERPHQKIKLAPTLEDSLRLPITTPDVTWRVAIKRDESDHRDGLHMPQAEVRYFSDDNLARRLNGELDVPRGHRAYFVFDNQGAQLVPIDFKWPSCTFPRRYWTDDSSLVYDLKDNQYAKLREAHKQLEACFSRLPSNQWMSLEELGREYHQVRNILRQSPCLSSGNVSTEALFCLVSGLSGCSFSGFVDPKLSRKAIEVPIGPFTLGGLFNYNVGDHPVIVGNQSIAVGEFSVSLCR